MSIRQPGETGPQSPMGTVDEIPPDSLKEGERINKIFIIYRDNELFAAHMPSVVETLTNLGVQINSHIFPAGTAKEEMADWIKTHDSELTEASFLCDQTLTNLLRKDERRYSDWQKIGYNLDDIFEDVVSQVVTGEEDPKQILEDVDYGQQTPEEKLEKTKGIFINIIRQIIVSQGNPKAIIIMRAGLNSHAPFGNSMKPESSMPETEVEKVLEDWLTTAGVTGKITSLELTGLDKYDAPSLRKLASILADHKSETPGDCWIIDDRHVPGSKVDKAASILSNKPLELLLPVESLLQRVIKEGLVHVEPKQIEARLMVVLNKLFAPPKHA